MSILDRARPEPDRVLRYADRVDAEIDLFLPAGPAETLVVLVHGGFWRAAYDRAHVRPLARALADDGLVVALPEYRRVGAGGGWPRTCEDVRLAVTSLPGLCAAAGISAPRTVLAGHSAGGHLVLWLAGIGAAADAVVPIAPVGDLRAALAAGVGDGAVAAFLGGPEPVDDADPAVLLTRSRPAYPITVLHGDADDEVPVGNSRGLVARHPWIALRELPGVDHYAPIDPLTAVYPTLRAALTG